MSEEIIENKIRLSATQIIKNVEKCLNANLVPMIHGSPGIGKSAIVQKLAEDYKLALIDLRLGQLDPTDANGFPFPDKERGRSGYLPPENFPLVGDTIPDGMDGWLLFLDEITSAPNAVQAAFYKIILDRMVGNRNLHNNVFIVCAGNLVTDRAIVNKLGTAMQSRLVHMEQRSDVNSWLEWAEDNDIDHKWLSYVRFSGNLNNFDPDHNDHTFTCERTIEFASRLTKGNDITMDDIPLIAGAVGLGTATEFTGFCEVYEQLPTISDILKSPKHTMVPNEPSALYALSGAISKQINVDNISDFMIYVKRMDLEFQVITLRGVMRNDPKIFNHKEVSDWSIAHASRLAA